jgi:hypothetical protein
VIGGDGMSTNESWELAFQKIGGICQVAKDSIDNPELPELLKIRALLRTRVTGYFIPYEALNRLKVAYSWGVTLNDLREIARMSRHWTNFNERIEEAIAHYKKASEEF